MNPLLFLDNVLLERSLIISIVKSRPSIAWTMVCEAERTNDSLIACGFISFAIIYAIMYNNVPLISAVNFESANIF